MSTYVLSFRGPAERTATPDLEAAWNGWFGELGGAVTGGHRVGRTEVLGGAADPTEVLTGYVLVEADSLEAAAALAKGCPGLTVGDRVEVGEPVDM